MTTLGRMILKTKIVAAITVKYFASIGGTGHSGSSENFTLRARVYYGIHDEYIFYGFFFAKINFHKK